MASPHDMLLARVLQAVDAKAYRTPVASAPSEQRAALEAIHERLHDPSVDVDTVRALAQRLHERGHLDEVHLLSALGVVAASPRVRDYAEAARLADAQELAAWRLGGPHLDANLASVDRHRGVVFFLEGKPEAALEPFTRAFERQRTAENLGNVLACLIRLGEHDEAQGLLTRIRRSVGPDFVSELDRAIHHDPDLAALRPPESP